MTAGPGILIVEDEPITSFDLEQNLKDMGYHSLGTAGTAAEALKMAKATPPDAVLMDINLAGDMDGIAAAEELRKLRPVPIVFVTAHYDKATLDRTRGRLAYGYVLKPFRARELKVAIDLALARGAEEARAAGDPAEVDGVHRLLHDIRSPLSALLGWSRLLIEDPFRHKLPASWERGLDYIHRGARRMQDLVDSLPQDLRSAAAGERALSEEAPAPDGEPSRRPGP